MAPSGTTTEELVCQGSSSLDGDGLPGPAILAKQELQHEEDVEVYVPAVEREGCRDLSIFEDASILREKSFILPLPVLSPHCPSRSRALPTQRLSSKLGVMLDGFGCADIDELADEAALAAGCDSALCVGFEELPRARAIRTSPATTKPGPSMRRPSPSLSRGMPRTLPCQTTCVKRPPASTSGPGPAKSQLLQGEEKLDITDAPPRQETAEMTQDSLVRQGTELSMLLFPGQPTCSDLPTTFSPSWASPKARPIDFIDGLDDSESESEDEDHQTVLLQVYHFHTMTKSLGLPIFHVGVEVGGHEFYFGPGGVCQCRSRCMNNYAAHVKTVNLGQTVLSVEEVADLVHELAGQWLAEDYNLLGSNCQTFAVEFVTRLGLLEHLPLEYVSYSNWLGALGGSSRPSRSQCSSESTTRSTTGSKGSTKSKESEKPMFISKIPDGIPDEHFNGHTMRLVMI